VHEKLNDFLQLLFCLVASLDIVKGDVDVFRRDLVVAAAHAQERDVEDLSQRNDDRDDDQDGSNLE
jgi:hypothetical protein